MNALEIARWLTTHNVGAFNRSTGIELVEVARAIRSWGDEAPEDVQRYADAIETVCGIAAVHQQAFLALLENAERDRLRECSIPDRERRQ